MADLTYRGLLLDKAGHTKLNLLNGEAVIYSPYGSGKAFVLSGVALQVYELLENGLTVEEITNTSQSPEWEETVQAVIEYSRNQLHFGSMLRIPAIYAVITAMFTKAKGVYLKKPAM
ncbi:MAG: hypothetical protein UV27_C0002G0064 [candidate division WWE3 bacterium GW2011_GWA1_42_46]|nr:MAG: hypothetical protein UV27_C0002G0064 [candidate division WWE3 bacterium GW2011_GWA1_42_46]